MRALIIAISASALTIASARPALGACGSYPLPVTGEFNEGFSAVTGYVNNWAQQQGINAATVAITYDKMLVYEQGFGYQDSACTQQIYPDAQMRLATDSTPITRRALQQLIADNAIFINTGVWQYLQQFFTLPPSSESRLQSLTVQDLLENLSCTSDANLQDNIQVGLALGLNRPANAIERIQYFWNNPAYIMPASTQGCSPGSYFSTPAYTNGFSHVAHEIAAAIIAAAQYKMAGGSTFNDTFLTGYVGNWYGQYVAKVGQHVGATLLQAGSRNSVLQPFEIWYDSGSATACPEWNYWACAYTNPPTQPKVPSAYAIDMYARPGSGTIVASARDLARFMVSYDWANDNSVLTNSISALKNKTYPCCSVGSLDGTTALMNTGKTLYGGQYHFWNWVLLANKRVTNSTFDIGPLLDNGTNGIFNLSKPNQDLFIDYTMFNRWISQYAYVSSTNTSKVFYAGLGTSTNPNSPYNTFPDARFLWRILQDASGYYNFTNEQSHNLMISNEDKYPYAELLAPHASWWSEEWTLQPAPDGNWYQPINRWTGSGLNVQNQLGYVEESPIQTYWWSADWSFTPVPSGLCCTTMTSTASCPSLTMSSQICLCGTPGCPAYTP